MRKTLRPSLHFRLVRMTWTRQRNDSCPQLACPSPPARSDCAHAARLCRAKRKYLAYLYVGLGFCLGGLFSLFLLKQHGAGMHGENEFDLCGRIFGVSFGTTYFAFDALFSLLGKFTSWGRGIGWPLIISVVSVAEVVIRFICAGGRCDTTGSRSWGGRGRNRFAEQREVSGR